MSKLTRREARELQRLLGDDSPPASPQAHLQGASQDSK
jgi:hypothetical protein